ncbi:hypothetical protein [Actinokineospora iranica]|uniref:DUF2019 domain-containing protein n=1 Tax=Actinokineospora iranica TaxID=1271860 RepID=A0A1G6SQM1_9PSEU|nr:hypothetical protein [Actinokineospora iranica]SDD18476.1 hypothetical protein SAMN05216174_10885 [Actinokineospora iranica]
MSEAGLYRFRNAVLQHWRCIEVGNNKEADAHTSIADEIARDWESAGQTHNVLVPLLAEAEPVEVRCAAAIYLLHVGYEDEALPVLESLAANDSIGLVASAAELTLLGWEKRQG